MDTFDHMELSTDDAEAAKAFYGSGFGWKFKGFPMGPQGTYWMATAPGAERPLGGIQNKPMPDMPTAWTGYVTVKSHKATADKVRASGGQVLVGPMEVPGMGMFAVCLDPTGGAFAIWESLSPPPAPAKKKAAAKKAAPKKAAPKKAAPKKAAKKKKR